MHDLIKPFVPSKLDFVRRVRYLSSKFEVKPKTNLEVASVQKDLMVGHFPLAVPAI